MELKDFVKQTIIEICDGIKEVKSKYGDKNAPVAPSFVHNHSVVFSEGKNIEFDIAVTTSSTEKQGIGGGVKITIFSVGANSEDEVSQQNVSRIKFSVPFYPQMINGKLES